MDSISSALRRLNLSESEQAIYLSLLKSGQATPRILAARTGITRPSVYDQLHSLLSLGLVVELDIDGKAHFAAADLKYLDALLSDQIDRLEQSRDFLAEALPAFKDSLQTITPKVRFFAGADGAKQLLKDVMWHDNDTIFTIWPETEMKEIFDPAFLHWFDERRLIRNLAMRVLWPTKYPINQETLFTRGQKDQHRHLPKKATVSMATLIYDNKAAFISSSHEAFGFIVESSEFATLEKVKFSALWESSK